MEAAFKYRIYPNQEQITLIQKTFGCARFVYNHFLEERIKTYKETGKTPTRFEQSGELTILKKELPWLAEIDSQALTKSLKHLDAAYKNFFRRVKGGAGKPGFPKFKSKADHHKSYETAGCIHVNDKAVKLPKLGWVKAVISRPIQGRILNATVSQTPSGKYFVSFCCTDVEFRQYPSTGLTVGLDLGIASTITTSDGTAFANPKYLAKSQKKLAKLQRQMSRKQKGSKNWEKARIKVARCHEKIANQRKDSLHKLTTKLVREYDAINIENFAVRDMMHGSKYAKSIADAAWGELVRQLTYKCEWQHKQLVKIDRYFPSNQTCSVCGYQNKELKDITVKEWTCPQCGTVHNRCKNSAAVVLDEGLKGKSETSQLLAAAS